MRQRRESALCHCFDGVPFPSVSRREASLSAKLADMLERFYYTYIAASCSRMLYVGITRDLERRVSEHKSGTCAGFAATYQCHRLVWFERYSSPDAAIAREKQLKGWRREKKTALIEGDNTTWENLSGERGRSFVEMAAVSAD
jgi:putative endonuclease